MRGAPSAREQDIYSTARRPMPAATCAETFLARPLAQEAEKPEQQDDRQRDPDEPEKTTFQHDNLHFPAQERQLRAVGSTCTVPALLAGASGANAVTQSVA